MKRLALLIVLAAICPLFAAGQGAPFTGTGQISLAPSVPSLPAAGSFTVDVNVNLTGVAGTCNGPTPAVLGGYSVPINFNPAQLQFVSAAACTSPQFAMAPTATEVATANASGQVTIAASQTNQTAPTGNVCVARLTFQVTGPPTAPASLTPQNNAVLSSAFQDCVGGGSAGPAAIPFVVVGVTIPALIQLVPTLSTVGLLLLSIAIAAAAMYLLR